MPPLIVTDWMFCSAIGTGVFPESGLATVTESPVTVKASFAPSPTTVREFVPKVASTKTGTVNGASTSN